VAGCNERAMPPHARPRNGLIETRTRRFVIAANHPSTTTEMLRQIYPGPRQHWQYWAVRRAAAKFCIRVGRSRSGSGRPWLWVLKPSA
jgi:hypothetical protein